MYPTGTQWPCSRAAPTAASGRRRPNRRWLCRELSQRLRCAPGRAGHPAGARPVLHVADIVPVSPRSARAPLHPPRETVTGHCGVCGWARLPLRVVPAPPQAGIVLFSVYTKADVVRGGARCPLPLCCPSRSAPLTPLRCPLGPRARIAPAAPDHAAILLRSCRRHRWPVALPGAGGPRAAGANHCTRCALPT